MNQVILLGYLTKDPYISGELTKFSIATRIFKGKTAYVPVTAFGLSPAQQEYLKKGVQILIKGTVQQTSYKKKDTEEMIYTVEVTANKSGIRFIGNHSKKYEEEEH